MTKRLQSITNKAAPAILIIALLTAWQMVSAFGIVPKYMLPSPLDVLSALWKDLPALLLHARTTLLEAFLGLGCSILLAFAVSFLMDRFALLHRAVYPLLILSQTIPTVAIAPLLVLWLGYDILPKVVLIIITCFFPMTIGLLSGFASADTDAINLLRAMGASRWQIFWHIKLPSAMVQFFSGLRVAASYSVVGGVVAEWLGGFEGLGVYMMRVKKSYAYDKMFAVIFLISLISLLLMKLVDLLQHRTMPWTCLTQTQENTTGE